MFKQKRSSENICTLDPHMIQSYGNHKGIIWESYGNHTSVDIDVLTTFDAAAAGGRAVAPSAADPTELGRAAQRSDLQGPFLVLP